MFEFYINFWDGGSRWYGGQESSINQACEQIPPHKYQEIQYVKYLDPTM